MSIVHRGVEQLVARQAHNLEVIRSSRVSATKTKCRVDAVIKEIKHLFYFFYFWICVNSDKIQTVLI